MNKVNLKREDINKLRLIGHGKDANVYDAKNGFLYKVYHKNLLPVFSTKEDAIYDTFGVRLDKPKQIDSYPTKHLDYIDKDETKLFSASAIDSAVLKQASVFNTTLPLGSLYIDDHFEGCVLKYHKYHTGIHNISSLPMSTKLKIMKDILTNATELLNNNIYHLHLSNKKVDNNSHSNILISPTGKVEIIDIDGRSAVYRETKSDVLNDLSINNCAMLFYEILFDLDIPVDMQEEDKEYLKDYLKNKKLPIELIDLFLNGNNNIDSLTELLNCIKVKKKRKTYTKREK